jgi:hypothetical protein
METLAVFFSPGKGGLSLHPFPRRLTGKDRCPSFPSGRSEPSGFNLANPGGSGTTRGDCSPSSSTGNPNQNAGYTETNPRHADVVQGFRPWDGLAVSMDKE